MPREFEIELGGKTFTIRQLPTGQADIWRQAVEQPLTEIVEQVATASEIDLSELGQSMAFIKAISTRLVNSPSTIRALLLVYSPELQAEADFILENAYDDEIFEAFAEVLARVYPFGTLLSRISEAGLMTRPISANSAVPSGASQKKRSARSG